MAPGLGMGVFATFLKTCGILLVIVSCLSPEHFVSVFLEQVILLSAKLADSLRHGGFLASDTRRFCSPLGIFTACTEAEWSLPLPLLTFCFSDVSIFTCMVNLSNLRFCCYIRLISSHF